MAGFTSQSDRLFPNVGNQVVMDSSVGNNFYNALNLRVEKRLGYGLNFLLNYTWSKNLESGSGGNSAMQQNGGTTNPLDSWNLRKEKSYSAMDLPHVFVPAPVTNCRSAKGSRGPARTGSRGPWRADGS